MAVIRNIVVKIGADISALQQGLKDAQSSLEKTGRKFTDLGGKLTTALTLPIAGIGAAMLKAGADFEEGMSGIKAVSGASTREMQDLQALAMKMGAETKYSAKEAATGIEELIKAGVSVTDILNGGLKGALSLAAAGELELGEAAEIASTALNAFKADNLSVGQAADILAGAANASATSVQEMKYSLSACAAVASSVGLSFKDTSTAIAVFAQNGLKGSDAGTSLKTMLMNLQPSTKAQAELFKQLGLITKEGTSAFFDANGRLKSMADIAGLLRGSMQGLTDAQRLQAMQTMFGSDAIRAANILYKEGAEGIQKMQQEMAKTTAAEVAAERMNNFKGALEQLKGSLETLGISFSQIMLPFLKKAADGLTELTNKLGGLLPETQKVILALAGLAAAIGPVLLLIGTMATGISAGIGAISLLISPIGLIVAAVVGLGSALIYLWNTNEGFKNALITAWEAIENTLAPIFNSILIVASTVFAKLWESLQVLFSNVQPLWEDLKQLFVSLGEVIKVLWQLLQPIFTAFGGVVVALLSICTGVINGIIQALGPLIDGVINAANIIVAAIGLVIALLNGDWAAAWDFMKSIAENTWQLIKNIFTAIVNFVKGFVEGVIAFFKGLWYALVGGSIIPDIVNGALGWFKKLLSGVNQTVGTLVSSVENAFNSISNIIQNLVGNAWQWGANLIEGLARGIRSGISYVDSAVRSVASKIRGFLGFSSPTKEGPGREADKWMPNMIAMLEDGIKKGLPNIQSAALELADSLSALGSPTPLKAAVIPSKAASQASSLHIGNLISVDKMEIAGDMDVYKLSQKIAELLKEQMYLAGVRL